LLDERRVRKHESNDVELHLEFAMDTSRTRIARSGFPCHGTQGEYAGEAGYLQLRSHGNGNQQESDEEDLEEVSQALDQGEGQEAVAGQSQALAQEGWRSQGLEALSLAASS
jgi:hypothetical protein